MATEDDGSEMTEAQWQLEIETRLVAVERVLIHLTG